MLEVKELQKVQRSFTGMKDRLAFVFEALGDPTRLNILRLLSKGEKDLCVTDVANVFKISVPAASYQLKVLEVVGLIERERMGKMTCYTLRKKDPLVKSVLKIIQ
ncbi:winged helix-turn-helix transcriptional regulator [Patescibacteria group bacterium]|nr:winged helix-turn-helix transcriptional regulator [Patescibacteria group bacterium]